MNNKAIEEMTDEELTVLAAGGQFCECGCGAVVMPDKKGRPRRFINGHQNKGCCHYSYNNGRYVNSDGYVMVMCPEHPRAVGKGYVREHMLVMEKALGRQILVTERIHHIDSDKTNNAVGNLLVFKTHSMHNAFEARLRAFKATGNWEWKMCLFCHKYDDPARMAGRSQDSSMYHRNCRLEYEKGRHSNISSISASDLDKFE